MKSPSKIITLSTLMLVFIALVLAFLFSQKDLSSQNQISGFVVKDEGYTYCKDYNFENSDLEQYDSLKLCANYKDTIVSEMANLGMLDLGIDPLLIVSLAQQESSCTSPNARGVLQVDGCANGQLYCPDETTRISEGLKIFKKNYLALQSEGVQGEELIQLTLFAYNRGLATAESAKQKLDQGFSLQEAMADSCAEVFNKQCYGTETYCRYTAYRKDKCTDEGLGAGYPEKILQRYEKNCANLDGDLEKGSYSYADTKIETYGTYKTNPGFSIQNNHNTKIYDELEIFAQQTIDECKQNTQTCIEQKKIQFAQDHPGYYFGECSNKMNEIVFYDFLENFYDCMDAVENSCACNLITTYDSPRIISEQEFNQKYGLFFEKISDNGYVVSFRNGELSKLSLKEYGSMPPIVVSTKKSIDFSEIGFEYNNNNFESSTADTSGANEIYLVLDQNTDSYKLVKTGNSNIPVCAPKKSNYVFCLHTGEKYFTDSTLEDYYSGNTEKVPAEKELIIRFALNLKDDVPPEISGLETSLVEAGSQTFLKISFTEKTEPIEKADVYFTQQPYSYVSDEQVINLDKKEITDIVDASSYSEPSCQENTCRVALQKGAETFSEELEESKAFRITEPPLMPKIVYFLPVVSSQDYFVAIHTFDGSGNPSSLLKAQ